MGVLRVSRRSFCHRLASSRPMRDRGSHSKTQRGISWYLLISGIHQFHLSRPTFALCCNARLASVTRLVAVAPRISREFVYSHLLWSHEDNGFAEAYEEIEVASVDSFQGREKAPTFLGIHSNPLHQQAIIWRIVFDITHILPTNCKNTCVKQGCIVISLVCVPA